jgi:hypothetical protein
MGLYCHLHQLSTEQDMPLHEVWKFSRFLTHRIWRWLVWKAPGLIHSVFLDLWYSGLHSAAIHGPSTVQFRVH